MIKKICICIGAYNAGQAFSDIASQASKKLADMGITYPLNRLQVIVWPYTSHNLLVSLATEQGLPSLRYHLELLRSDMEQGHPETHTLILSSPYFIYCPQNLEILLHELIDVFPKTAIAAVLLPERQDLDIEALGRNNYFFYGAPTFGTYWANAAQGYIPDYLTIIGLIHKILGAEALLVPEDTSLSAENIVNILAVLTGITAGQADDLLQSGYDAARYNRLLIPRELVQFAAVCNFASVQPLSPGFISTWAEQWRHFMPGGGFPGSLLSLWPLAERKALAEGVAGSNTRAATLLGRESLFPPFTEQDWEPPSALSPEGAYEITRRLDTAFCKHLVRKYAHTPIDCQALDQKICYQALLEAVEPACPPPRVYGTFIPKLAVLTTTYNHEKYIGDCIESVISQAVDFPIVHIIADDASTDATQKIVKTYAKKYRHIIPIFEQTNTMGVGNLQRLFSAVRSPYVALCEGDDYFTDSGKLQKQVDFLEAHPECSLCFHPVLVAFEDDPTQKRFFPTPEALPHNKRPPYSLSDIIQGNFIQTNSVVYRWRFVYGLPQWFSFTMLPADWYWHLLHAEVGDIGFIDEVMAVYRRHSNALFYTAEKKSIAQRTRFAYQELATYDAINKHFLYRFDDVIQTLASGIFADCLTWAMEMNDYYVFNIIVESFPRYSQEFVRSVSRNA